MNDDPVEEATLPVARSVLGRWSTALPGGKPTRPANKPQQTTQALPVLKPNAAGIAIASQEIFVAVPHDRTDHNSRAFGTFTCDLNPIADWLQECQIDTVAIESTRHFWLPLFQILTDRGLDVYLVNAQQANNVPGQKTDVCDGQWLQ